MKTTKTIVPMSTLALMRAELARYVPAPEAEHVEDSGITFAEHTMMIVGAAPAKVLHLRDVLVLSYKLSNARRLAAQ